MALNWDDYNVKQTFKFQNVGDTITGTIIGSGEHEFLDGSRVPEIDIMTIEGETWSVALGAKDLLAKSKKARLDEGDYVSITYTGDQPIGSFLKKVFDVKVEKAKGSITGKQTELADPPF